MNSKAVNMMMPTELYDKLKAEAKRKSISLAALIRMICSEWLEQK